MAKRRDIKNFYIDEDFIPVWNSFTEICNREGESKSQKIRGMIARYVAVHAKGNPQLLLATFIGPTTKICWKCRGQFPHLIHVKFLSGLKTFICETCKLEYDKRRLIKKVLK